MNESTRMEGAVDEATKTGSLFLLSRALVRDTI